jgi:S1-C subfamily serine protease
VADEQLDSKAVRDAAEIYQKALQEVIKEAEPSIACVLVSRSDVYKKIFHDEPPADNPGKLGGFDRSRADVPMLPSRGRGMRGFRRDSSTPQDPLKKYDLGDKDTVPELYGSGVVVEPPQGSRELLILTSYHLIRDATKIYVRLPAPGEQSKGSYADIHAADPRSDLAVLRLSDTSIGPLRPLKRGDAATLRKGSFVVSLANLYAGSSSGASATAAHGIVSNLLRPREFDTQRALGAPQQFEDSTQPKPLYLVETLIQTDAPLNSGCSGGALVNLRGELVGLTTPRATLGGSDRAGGYAMPINKAMERIIQKLCQGEEVAYGYLGIRSEKDRTGRMRITHVLPGSPAQAAGLQSGYTVVSINGERVYDNDDIYLKISTLLAGTTARLEIGTSQDVTPQSYNAKLLKSYTAGKIIAATRPAAVRGLRVDYTSVLQSRQPQANNPWQPREQPLQSGVLVCELQPGSKAAAHLRLNDVITHMKIDDRFEVVTTPAEFYRLAAKVPANQALELNVLNSEPVIIP